MPTATTIRTRRHRQVVSLPALIEQLTQTVPDTPYTHRVDRERKVIRGVKVLGIDSGNSAKLIGVDAPGNYSYSVAAMKAAVSLYEGAVVNIDHPRFRYDGDGTRRPSHEDRSTADRFGRLVNVRVVEDGMYGDLEYLSAHPLAEMILEAAERMPETLALSHHAFGDPVVHDDGRIVIERINEVRSVDLIGEPPGTTTSLFESEADMQQDEKKLTEEMHEDELINEQEGEPEPPPPEKDLAAKPVEKVAAGFDEAIVAVTTDPSLTPDVKKQQTADLIDAKETAVAVVGTGDDTEVAEEGDEEDQKDLAEQEDDEQKKPAAESLRSLNRRVALLERRERAYQLIVQSGVSLADLTEARREAIVNGVLGCKDDAQRKVLLESLRGPSKSLGPRPEGSTRLTEAVGTFPENTESFVKSLRS